MRNLLIFSVVFYLFATVAVPMIDLDGKSNLFSSNAVNVQIAD